MKFWSVNDRQVLHVPAHELSLRNQVRVTSGLPSFIRELLKPNAVWVAGGALRSSFDKTPVADFDLFFESATHAMFAEAQLYDMGARAVFTCPAGKLRTFELGSAKIQLITPRYYSTAFDLVGSFDFTVCQFAFDGRYVTIGRDALADTKVKRLVVQKMEYPVATLNRMGKYRWGKGYFMSELEWAKVISVIQSTTFDSNNLQLYID